MVTSETFRHYKHGLPSKYWAYHNADGSVYFYVARYDLEEGKKEIIPWIENGEGWKAQAPPEPRPLYRLPQLLEKSKKTVIIVEGEKCADALAQCVGDIYDVTTWPGGANSAQKTDWSPLKNREIIIWQDNDKAGCKAALMVYFKLLNLASDVVFTKINGFPVGWDVADAIRDGWNKEKIIEWLRDHISGSLTNEQLPPEEKYSVIWKGLDLKLNKYQRPFANLENVLKIMEAWPPMHNLVKYEMFSGKKINQETKQIWRDVDTFLLTARLQSELDLSTISVDTVQTSIETYATTNLYNAPLEWISALQWDGVSRIDSFFTHAVGADDNAYAKAISRNFWLSLCARLKYPGCQCDYMVILEGRQGIGKTQSLRIIGGDWYTSIQASVMDKDFLQGIKGKWIIEVAELDAFNKAENSKIKSILTTTIDHYRKAYAREVLDYKRSCIFVGTTNQECYLADDTGARRFWPIRCKQIDLNYTHANREQLFAEAWYRLQNNENWHEVPQQAVEEEQEQRRVVDPWEPIIMNYAENYNSVTIEDIWVNCLRMDAGRITMKESKRMGSILKRFGWIKKHTKYGNSWEKSLN